MVVLYGVMGFNFVFLKTTLNAGVSRVCADLMASIKIARLLLFLFLVLKYSFKKKTITNYKL